MNKLSTAERVQVLHALIEGNSINATVRMTGISKPTILKLIRDFAAVCEAFHDERVVNLPTLRVQMDELWAFVGAKEYNTKPEKKEQGWGDCWTWTAIDADNKLMISWMIGPRDHYTAREICIDTAKRISNRVQVTSDGLHAYDTAVYRSFGGDVDFAQLVKQYGIDRETPSHRYSPPKCIGVKIQPRYGNPDPAHISTSFVERHNLTIRMSLRRYTRLTNGHSKKLDNHVAMTSIFMTTYNWCRRHQSLAKQTPAMAAGLTDHKWELAELVELMG